MSNIQFDQSLYKKLSTREIETARAAKVGLTMKETADKLGVSIETIKCFRKRARQKLGSKNFTEVVVALMDAGIL